MAAIKFLNDEIKSNKALFWALIVITIGATHLLTSLWLSFMISNSALINENVNLLILSLLVILTKFTGGIYGSAIAIIIGLFVIIKWQKQMFEKYLAIIGIFAAYISLNILFLNFISN